MSAHQVIHGDVARVVVVVVGIGIAARQIITKQITRDTGVRLVVRRERVVRVVRRKVRCLLFNERVVYTRVCY